MKKSDSDKIFQEIPLSKVITSNTRLNRGGEDVTEDPSFFRLVKSIKTLKTLINPVTVIKKDAQYEIVAGERRFAAYKFLKEEDPTLFSRIPAIVLDGTMDEVQLNAITHHENEFRKNLDSVQEFEFKVSIIPEMFGLSSKDDPKKNFEIGMEILKRYIAAVGAKQRYKKQETVNRIMNELVEVTGHEDPLSIMGTFFYHLGESPEYFWKKRKIFEYDQEIVDLYAAKKITYYKVKDFADALKIDEQNTREIIRSFISGKVTKREAYRGIEKILQEKKKEEPVTEKELSKIIGALKKLNKMIKSTERHISMKNAKEIEKHIEKINTLIKES